MIQTSTALEHCNVCACSYYAGLPDIPFKGCDLGLFLGLPVIPGKSLGTPKYFHLTETNTTYKLACCLHSLLIPLAIAVFCKQLNYTSISLYNMCLFGIIERMLLCTTCFSLNWPSSDILNLKNYYHCT
jgi:hypothetical protein